jgi:hypothetical protein
MLFIPVAILIVVGVVVFRMLARRRHPATVTPGHIAAEARPGKAQAMPTSREGAWSLWVALVAMVLTAVPTIPHAYTSIPLAVVAAALAAVAMIRRHDRAAMLWLPIVFGVGVVVLGAALWIGG